MKDSNLNVNNNLNLCYAIEDALEQADAIKYHLDKISNDIKMVEKSLNQMPHFEFEFVIPESGYSISWKRYPESKNKSYFLFLIDIDRKYKRLGDCNISLKTRFYPYLKSFIDNFALYLKKQRILLEGK